MGNRAYSFEEVIEEITTGEISFAHKKTIEVITESLPFSERFDYSIYKSASTAP